MRAAKQSMKRALLNNYLSSIDAYSLLMDGMSGFEKEIKKGRVIFNDKIGEF